MVNYLILPSTICQLVNACEEVLTWQCIGDAILELVSVVICIGKLSHVHFELSQALHRKESNGITSTFQKKKIPMHYIIITASLLHRSHIELRLEPRLPIAVSLLQLSHALTESVYCDLRVARGDAL